MKYGLADWVGDWNPEYVKGLFRTDQGQDVRALPPARRLRLVTKILGRALPHAAIGYTDHLRQLYDNDPSKLRKE